MDFESVPKGDWVVVLEFGALHDEQLFELGMVQALVDRLCEWHASGLFHPDRYAIQLHMSAAGADEALQSAVFHHGQAARALGTIASFCRGEVLTLDEFGDGWHDSAPTDTSAPTGAVPALTSIDAYEATRSLLSASTPSDIAEILARFVVAVGGRVNVGLPRHVTGMVSIDLSTSPGDQLHAVADSFSVAALIIERWLPPLIDDAKRSLVLMRWP